MFGWNRGLLASALVVVTVGTMAFGGGSAEAAKGGRGGSGGGTTAPASITLNQTDPHLGSTINFTTNGGSNITVACYQGGVGSLVWAAEGSTGSSFVLGANSVWATVGGPAYCYAWLKDRTTSIAATSFAAGG